MKQRKYNLSVSFFHPAQSSSAKPSSIEIIGYLFTKSSKKSIISSSVFVTPIIEKAGYKPGEEVALALDVAATELYDEAKKIGKEGQYHFWSSIEIIGYLFTKSSKKSIISSSVFVTPIFQK